MLKYFKRSSFEKKCLKKIFKKSKIETEHTEGEERKIFKI